MFGLHRAADTAGAVVGPLLGLALYELLGHRLRPLFWIALVPAVLSALMTRAVREHRKPAAVSAPVAAARHRLLRDVAEESGRR